MLPIALFLCFAALTVHSENSDIPSTLHEIYLLQCYEFTIRFKIRSINFWFNLYIHVKAIMLGDGLLTKGGLCMKKRV